MGDSFLNNLYTNLLKSLEDMETELTNKEKELPEGIVSPFYVVYFDNTFGCFQCKKVSKKRGNVIYSSSSPENATDCALKLNNTLNQIVLFDNRSNWLDSVTKHLGE